MLHGQAGRRTDGRTHTTDDRPKQQKHNISLSIYISLSTYIAVFDVFV